MEYRCNDGKMMEVQVSVEATEEHPAMNWFGRIKSKATVSEYRKLSLKMLSYYLKLKSCSRQSVEAGISTPTHANNAQLLLTKTTNSIQGTLQLRPQMSPPVKSQESFQAKQKS